MILKNLNITKKIIIVTNMQIFNFYYKTDINILVIL